MSNGEMKRRAAIKHNLAMAEAEAYAQDRIEQPLKYRHIRVAGSKATLSTAMLLAIAGSMEQSK